MEFTVMAEPMSVPPPLVPPATLAKPGTGSLMLRSPGIVDPVVLVASAVVESLVLAPPKPDEPLPLLLVVDCPGPPAVVIPCPVELVVPVVPTLPSVPTEPSVDELLPPLLV